MITPGLPQISNAGHGVLARLIVFFTIATGCAFAQCDFPSPQSTNEINYTFEPLFESGKMAMRVSVHLRGGPTGRLQLDLPSGPEHYDRQITELKAVSPNTSMTDGRSPAQKEVRFPPRAAIRVSYVLVKDWNGLPDTDTRFRADLEPERFHIIGANSLVYPALSDFDTVHVNFDWQKLPAKWPLATSFGSQSRCQSFHGTWWDALHSLFVGGDYRLYHTAVSGNALDFAIRGKWSFSDEDWIARVQKIVEFERKFWQDERFPYFLITLDPMAHSIGGTALTNAFMEHVSQSDALSPAVLGTIAHETFHTWTSNPGKIGYRPQESKYLTSWFWEGFTYYYQDVMLLRSGMNRFPDYVAAINDKLRKYEADESIDVPLKDFARHHSADLSNQIDSRHGAGVAVWLDATIRKESNNRSSLDDLMFDLFRQNTAYEHGHEGKPMELNNERIFRAAAKYLTRSSRALLRRYVEQGGDIPAPEDALGPCVPSHVEEIRQYHLGFDRPSASSEEHIVRGVDPASEAYRAGLRDGMQLSGWSFNPLDPSKQVRLYVKTTDGVQTLTYYPLGSKRRVRQFSLDSAKYVANPGACESWAQPVRGD